MSAATYRPPLDPYLIDTDPGSGGAMAPPSDWCGDFDAYRGEIRRRFRSDPEARQSMLIAARRFDPTPSLSPITFRGRYAHWARALIETAKRDLKAGQTRH
jgi:hypothetical protein